jgi:serine/threonine-protein kinase
MGELNRLGRYQLVRVLGRGAMGVVYEGLDPALNRRVAVKTILRNAAIDDETARAYSAQFAREAQAAGRLNHPNIVQVHDFAEEGDVAYLVMEYIQGRELRAFFEAKEPFTTAEAVRIMGELLDALDFAHEAGVIHRDVKPANVMLDAQRRVKLADFGVARIQDSERSAAGTMVGTPAFMSPEQIQGAKIDRRTDVFSAGVVFYQLLTGEQPFTGAGAWTVAKKIMQDDPPRPSAVVKSVSPVFDGIVDKALAKNPAQRYPSAREFAVALRGAAQPSASATLPPAPAPAAKPGAKATEAEVEFWRAIQNSSDAAEFEFYLEQFPEGTYAPLARHKIAKLREPAEAARKQSEETARLDAEARARREAEEQVRQEAEQRAARQAEERARREAEERAAREAQEQARRETEAQAKRAAEAAARKEAEARARREAEDKAKRDAEARAKQLAAEKARREAEESARKAQALARLKQLEEAAARAKSVVDEDATVAIGSGTPAAMPPAPPPAAKKSFAIPAVAAGAVIAIAIAAYLLLGRTPPPAPVAETPPAQKAATPPAAPAVDVARIQRETEERVRKEFADKAAAEKAATEKAVAEKAAAEKAAAEKLAAAKTAAERDAAEKAAQKATADRIAAEKAAADKAASAKATAEKAAADKAAAEKAASEKAAADKALADKAAAEKAAAAKPVVAAKPGVPAVGDRWVYEARETTHGERHFQASFEVKAVSGTTVTEIVHRGNGEVREVTHKPFLHATSASPGIVVFSPYLRAFQDLRDGQSWSDIDFSNLFNCSTNIQISCTVSGRVAGREKVSVKAGTFDATKVVLTVFIKSGFGGNTTVELRYWFADETNRFVKYEMRHDSRVFQQPQMDMELVSYTRAGGR